MYLLFLNLCIYYFKFMYLIYRFILFELCLLFLKSCIYSIHVFIIFEFIYLLFLTIKLFLCFYSLLFQDMSFANDLMIFIYNPKELVDKKAV